MRRLLALVLLVSAAAGACSSGGGDKKTGAGSPTGATTSTIPIVQLQSTASTVTDQLVAGQFDDVVSHFNAEMLLSMSADSLKTAWEQILAEFGAYKSRGTTAKSTATEVNATVFDTPLTFASKRGKARIAVDLDGKVALLRVLPADAA